MAEVEQTGIGDGEPVLKTLLLSDMVGSTRLVERLGDRQAFEIFGRHDRLARDLLQRFAGLEIDKTDGFLMLFERPSDAVGYAVAYHEEIRALAQETGIELASRVGIHLGEVYLRHNPAEDVARGAKPIEVEGLAKPMTARLMSLAGGRQTLISRAAFDLARRSATTDHGAGERSGSELRLRWEAHGAYLFKGVDEPVEVFEVGAVGRGRFVAPPDTDKVRRAAGDGTIVGWRPGPGLEVPERHNWVLERKLGEGGFGEVWLALHRKTSDSRVFKFCFESERLKGLQREVTLFRLLKEALGKRDDIARIIDWSFDSPPYFVESEYTAGGSLVDWVAGQGGVSAVPTADRLSLVAEAAEALAAAHSVGVLHKDIKPANILIAVDGDGRPHTRLTDFGIGLLTDTARLAEHGITVLGFTDDYDPALHSATGTWMYMAPELIEGKPSTVQCDIYALGVILYQLVVGDLNRAIGPGWERHVDDPLLREDIAVMVDGTPANRLADAAEVARRLRGLEDRRARREREELDRQEAARVQQELQQSRRRRKMSAAIGLFLLVFAVAMAIQARRIAREAERANREAETARQVADFLVEVFRVADPEEGRGSTVTARELLDQGAERVHRELAGQPLTQARLMEAIGTVYLGLGLYGEAEPLLQEAHEQRRELLPEGHPDLEPSLLGLGRLAAHQGRYEQAEELLRSVLAGRERRLGMAHPEVAEALEAVIELYRLQGRLADAHPLVRRVEMITARAAASGEPQAETTRTLELLALDRVVDLPADTLRVLGSTPQQGLVVAEGRQGLYLVDLNSKRPATPVPLEPDEQVLTGLPVGQVALRRGGMLVYRNLFSREQRVEERTVLDGIAADEELAVGARGRHIAVISRQRVRVHEVLPNRTQRLVEISLERPAFKVAVSEQYLAWVDQQGLTVASLATGTPVFSSGMDWQGRPDALVIDDHSAQVAVAGWFDEVLVYDLSGREPMSVMVLPGQAGDVFFLPDYPTLVVGKQGLVALWRRGAGTIHRYQGQGGYVPVGYGHDGLLIHDAIRHQLLSFRYQSMPLLQKLEISLAPLWAMTANDEGTQVFAGSADGQLLRYDLEEDRLQMVQAHSQGLTSLLYRDGQLVSGADDKTIAIWDAVSLQEVSRSKAHEFLVNFLHWDAASGTLWSSSSDRTLKAWSWPDLEQTEVVRTGDDGNAAFWLDSGRALALVGTWGGDWLELRRQPDWQVSRTVETASLGVYSVAAQPEVGVVVLLGVHPTDLWLYDLYSEQGRRLSHPDLVLGWATAVGNDRVVLVGDGCVASYRFWREEEALHYEARVGLCSEAPVLGIAAALPARDWIAAGGGEGSLFLFDLDTLPEQVLLRGRVP